MFGLWLKCICISRESVSIWACLWYQPNSICSSSVLDVDCTDTQWYLWGFLYEFEWKGGQFMQACCSESSYYDKTITIDYSCVDFLVSDKYCRRITLHICWFVHYVHFCLIFSINLPSISVWIYVCVIIILSCFYFLCVHSFWFGITWCYSKSLVCTFVRYLPNYFAL